MHMALWCAGGCPALTYRVTGRFDVRSPNCRIYQALFPEVLRLEGLRLLQYAGGSCLEAPEANTDWHGYER